MGSWRPKPGARTNLLPTMRAQAWLAIAEVALIFLLFFVLAGCLPPDVNEAHYLSKAKHYWNPAWCAGDLFLESADAHGLFYWTFGWLTLWWPLSAVAWTGRGITWLLLAWSWRRLSVAILPRPLWALLTAATFAMLLRLGHLAGEWVIGGVEAKGLAFVLLFLGLESLVQNRWSKAVILLGAASAFHVLVGGWSIVALALAWNFSRPDRPALRTLWPALVVGFLLSLAGLWPAVALSRDVDAETLREANGIYVHERLAHHLLFHRILGQNLTFDFSYLGASPLTLPITHLYFVRHLLLLVAGLALWRFTGSDPGARRLYLFVGGAIVIAAVGIVIDQATFHLPDLAATMLRYYWFRLSDVMIPLGVTFLAAQSLIQLETRRPAAASWCLIVLIVAVVANASDLFLRRRGDPRPPAVAQSDQTTSSRVEQMRRFDDWLRVCDWVRQHTRQDEIVLTPRHQQTFKWYAQRGEVVSWKDVPQDAAGVVEWNRRMNEIFPPAVAGYGLAHHGGDELLRLSRKYHFRYVIVDRQRSQQSLPFVRVFPPSGEASGTFEVYRLPLADDRQADSENHADR